MSLSLEIVCVSCGKQSLVRREPVYDGFKKVGEVFVCVSCGHRYEQEADVPFKEQRAARVFTEADRTKAVDVFAGDEKGRNCRHCVHYVVNPFVQRCGLHHRIVEATDCCGDFTRRGASDTSDESDESDGSSG